MDTITITTNYTYSNMMRLLSKTEGGTSTTFGYDRNLTSKTEGNSSYTYVWDYDNKLKELRDDNKKKCGRRAIFSNTNAFR